MVRLKPDPTSEAKACPQWPEAWSRQPGACSILL
jgi:hypothetical protein